jgi:Brp/Blh family beta-carotene 15,15'-monooxygenase
MAFRLLSTLFLLWLTIQVQSQFEDYLAYFFILTIGIMHGANDISIIGLITSNLNKSKLYFLLYYVGVIVCTALVFFQLPFLALLLFVAFSCYHFGEQHFKKHLSESSVFDALLYIGYGNLIFGLLFYFNKADTASIIFELTGKFISPSYFFYFLIQGIALTLLGVFMNRKNFNPEINVFQEVILILLFSILFYMASLLWAFSIYFILWHSLPSLKDQMVSLYGDVNGKSLRKYIKSSMIYWIISLQGLFLFFYVSQYIGVRFITLFFAFLAAITIPHVIVMYYLNKKRMS